MPEPAITPMPYTGPSDAYDSQPPLTAVERVTNTFVAPTKTFADLRRSTSWWLPFVLMVVCGYIFAVAGLTHIGPRGLAESSIRNNPTQNERMQNASPEQRAQTMAITATIIQWSLYVTPVFLLVFAAIGAGLLWMGFNFLLGGKTTYYGMFAVTMFSFLPGCFRSLLGTVMVFAGDPDSFNLNDPVGTNPGFYMGADSSVFLKTLLGSVDIFALWILLLMGIGGAIVARVKVKSGVVMVLAAWLIFVLVKAGIVAATS